MTSLIASIFLLALVANSHQFNDIQERQRPAPAVVTVTVVTQSSTTTTVVNPTFALCAKLVNATTACRRRREYWIDAPVVIALDDDIDERITQFFSKPTNVYQVEPTAVPVQLRSSPLDENAGFPTFQVLQPSLVPYNYYGSRVASPFFFGAFANVLSSLIQRTRTVFTTVTSTTTSTINLFFTTATRPFIIQGCVPASLPFSIC